MAIPVKDQQNVAPITSNVAAGALDAPNREAFGEGLHKQSQDIAQRAARVGQMIEDRNMQIYSAKEEADLSRRALAYANLAKEYQYSEKVDENGLPLGAMYKDGENAAGITRDFAQRDIEFTDKVMGGLSDNQKLRLFDKIKPHRSSVMGQLSSHEAGQQKKVVVDIAEAAHKQYLDMAAKGKGGGDLGELLNLVGANAASLADIGGLTSAAREVFIKGKSQEAVGQRIEAMLMDGDINGAQKTLETYKDAITNEGYTKLKDDVNTWIFNDRARTWLKPHTEANRLLVASRSRRLGYDEIMNANISDDAKEALLKVNEYNKQPTGRSGGGWGGGGGKTDAAVKLQLMSMFENMTDVKDEITTAFQKQQRTAGKGQKFSEHKVQSDATMSDLIEFQETVWNFYNEGLISDADVTTFISKMGGVINESIDALNSPKGSGKTGSVFSRRAKSVSNVLNENIYGSGIRDVRRLMQEQGIEDEVMVRNAQLFYVEALSVVAREKGISDESLFANLNDADKKLFNGMAMEYVNKKVEAFKVLGKVTGEYFFTFEDNAEIIEIYDKRVAEYIKDNKGQQPNHIEQIRIAHQAGREQIENQRKAFNQSIKSADGLTDDDRKFMKERKITDADIKATAKAAGISEKEVINRLRRKGVGNGR